MDKKFKKKEPLYGQEELQLRAKVGYQFDKVWKEKMKSRDFMQQWAVTLLKLDMPVQDFSLNKLTYEQVQVLGLKLKFEFNIV